MNKHLTNRIQEYLELETNYAIIVSGDYGIGKTHYIKNELFPVIKALKITNSQEGETFIPILISLFGVNSIEEIQNQIFLELYPILKNKGVKIFTGLGKSVYKFLSGSDFKDLLSDTNTSSSDLVDFSRVLLCIDDIDRKSPSLNIKEFFGFVNNLVENQNAKILLVANEEELRNETVIDENAYAVLREKVIGISITFKNNVSQIFDEIIESKYKTTHKNYFEFLSHHKAFIIQQITRNKDNLRNLLFFLEHFKIIFLKAYQLLKTEQKYIEIKQELMTEFLKFTLPIAIEYKLGKLNTSNCEQIENVYNGFLFNLSAFLGDKEKEVEKSYADIFKDTYFEDNQTRKLFFQSIFNYIMGKSSFIIEEFEDDIDSVYRFKENVIPERQKILGKLNYWHCIDLGLITYKKLTKQLIEHVDKGDFQLEEYPTIFLYAIRFDNVMNFQVDKLIKRFKKGIDSGKKNYKYKRYLSFQISMRGDEEFFNEIKEISEYCTFLNDEIQKNENKDELESLFNLYKTDFEKFLNDIQDDSKGINFTAFLSRFDFKKFSTHFKKISNTQVINFALYIERKYSNHVYEHFLDNKQFLKNLQDFISKELSKNTTPKLTKIAYEVLNKKIENVLPNF